MKRVCFFILCFIIYSMTAICQTRAKKFAFVAGCDNYGAGCNLYNCTNDVNSITNRLREMGFHVYMYFDIRKTRFDSAWADFTKVAAKSDVILFYYSGHGCTMNNEDYLIPIGVNFDSISDPYRSYANKNLISAKDINEDITLLEAKNKILFFDACRSSRFKGLKGLNNAASPGKMKLNNEGKELTRQINTLPKTPSRIITCYAVNQDKPAQTNMNGKNSYYTEAILHSFNDCSKSFVDMLYEITDYVQVATNFQQVPVFHNDNFSKDFHICDEPVRRVDSIHLPTVTKTDTTFVVPQHTTTAPGTSRTISDRPVISLQAFYDFLSPYGQWVEDTQYGNVWVPNEDAGFRPYGCRGYWAMTDYGNTWVSDDPWGWICYHFGRWTYDAYYGWAWIPGYEWAPAWVAWRYGGGYGGWAPLGPFAAANMKGGCPDSWWVFAEPQYMYQTDCLRHSKAQEDNGMWIEATSPVVNYYTDNNTGAKYNYGPRADIVQRDGKKPVKSYRLLQSNQPGAPVVNDNTLKIYRPEVNRKTTALSHPVNLVHARQSFGKPQETVTSGRGRSPFLRGLQSYSAPNSGVSHPLFTQPTAPAIPRHVEAKPTYLAPSTNISQHIDQKPTYVRQQPTNIARHVDQKPGYINQQPTNIAHHVDTKPTYIQQQQHSAENHVAQNPHFTGQQFANTTHNINQGPSYVQPGNHQRQFSGQKPTAITPSFNNATQNVVHKTNYGGGQLTNRNSGYVNSPSLVKNQTVTNRTVTQRPPYVQQSTSSKSQMKR